MAKIGSGPGMINKLYRGSFMDSLHVNSERGRVIGNLVSPSRGLRGNKEDHTSIFRLRFDSESGSVTSPEQCT